MPRFPKLCKRKPSMKLIMRNWKVIFCKVYRLQVHVYSKDRLKCIWKLDMFSILLDCLLENVAIRRFRESMVTMYLCTVSQFIVVLLFSAFTSRNERQLVLNSKENEEQKRFPLGTIFNGEFQFWLFYYVVPRITGHRRSLQSNMCLVNTLQLIFVLFEEMIKLICTNFM